MDYVYEMARTLREEEGLALTLLLEKGGSEAAPTWVKSQYFSLLPLRVLENFLFIMRERIHGTKIFYVHYSFISAIFAGLITAFFGGKVYYWNAGMPWQYKRPWYVEIYQSVAYRLIDVLVTGAESLRSGYMTTYSLKSEQIKIISNWIDLSHVQTDIDKKVLREKLRLPDEEPILLFVHKVVSRKGSQWLVPLMERLKNTRVHLVIAGDGSETQSITVEAESAGLLDRIHLLGRVERDSVIALYQACSIFIMPSQEEGSPHSLIEALAYGLPSICFAVGGVSDTMPTEAHAYLYPYGNIEAMAQGVDTLLSNEVEYRKMQQASLIGVKKFAKPIAVQKFKALLTEEF